MERGPINRLTRRQFQAMVFLLVLPAVNWLLLVTTLYDMGIGSPAMAARGAARLWLVFGLSFLVLESLRKYLPLTIDPDRFWRLLAVHVAVILGSAAVVDISFGRPVVLEQANSLVLPRIFLIMEITVYVAILWILRQQERNFEIAARMKDAELNVLKSQSNPHFLFNTLNLIAAEIASDPNRARETVFDLADLLRSYVRFAERRMVSVDEEMHLVSLYLSLQQRRFHDRLTVSIEIDPETADIQIPSLLLQPVVENTIKWAVAPFARPATIRLVTRLRGERMLIEVMDSGPGFAEEGIVEGDGFRILRKTLNLQYREDYVLSLRASAEGGVFSLDLPKRSTGGNHG